MDSTDTVVHEGGRNGQSASTRRRALLMVLPVLIVAGGTGWLCHGRYIKPHADFYEFRETGRAFLAGETPPTFKRGPVYPVLIALGGKAIGGIADTETPADQLAASWLSGLLMPINAFLLLLIGRQWMGESARWLALWFAILPIGWYCTASLLVEPLLVTLTLLTAWLAGRGSGWAYLAASAAIMTRYDAAGLLVGLTAADFLAKRKAWGTAWRCGAALGPLAIWLALTAATWEERATDHYLAQIAENSEVRLIQPLRTAFGSVWPGEDLATPIWLADYSSWMNQGVVWGIILAIAGGGAWLFWRREPAAMAGGGFIAGYWAVHAVFPFDFERFGYPTSPLLLAAAGSGLVAARGWAGRLLPGAAVRRLMYWSALAAVGVVLYSELDRLRLLHALRREWLWAAPYAAAAGAVCLGLAPWVKRGQAGGRILTTLVFLLMVAFFARQALPILGDGGQRSNVVEAARWLRDNLKAEEGVLCDEPGLQRMYLRDDSVERFVGYGGIEAEEWGDIVAECRRRGLRYVVWHDLIFAEQGDYYIRKWGLGRFGRLEHPDQASGLTLVKEYEGRPHVWLYRVSD